MDSINKRQFGILVFMIPLVFKVVTLPRLLASVAGADCYYAIAIMAGVELCMLGIVVQIQRMGGLKQFRKVVGDVAYRITTLPMLIVYMIKAIVYMAEATDYIANAMFYNITNYKVLIMLALIVLYVATKGFKGAARTVEILIWMLAVIAIVGICFGNVDLKFENLLPMLADGAGGVFEGVYIYGFWMLDLTPLLFVECKDIKQKKPYILAGASAMFAFIVVVYVAFIANYGGSAPYISNAFARLATFNVVNTEIGSIDWPSIVLWIAMSIIAVAINAVAGSKIIASGGKKGNISLAIFMTIAAIIAGVWLKNNEAVITFATSWIKYVLIALQIGVPVYILVCMKICKRGGYEEMA